MDVTKTKVAILLSGRGSNMMALVEYARDQICSYEVVLVASDRPAAGLAWADADGITTVEFPTPTPKDRSQYHQALDLNLTRHGVEIIALAGYMRLLSDDFVARWRGKVVNIHPSLLPKYKGLDTHARAIEAGDTMAGCSVHIVTEELDGGEVLGQAEVPILPGDTPDTLAARVLEAEHRLYPQILTEFCSR